MFLNMRSQFLCVSFLQSLNSLIVVFEILKLTLEILASLIELLLHIL
jgi:hypothetical protein